MRRLDYIFISNDLEAIDANVIAIDQKASDHLPFMAALSFLQTD
jgi:endonuclease/exonuclease/phosphatase family metal-dependent hydrolase